MRTVATAAVFAAAYAVVGVNGKAPPGLEAIPFPRTLEDAKKIHSAGMRATAARMAAHGHVVNMRSAARGGCPASTNQGAAVGTISPMDFGADPTGLKDSTEAFAAAVAALVNTTGRAARPMASGITNLGGATLDLGGGQYLIAAPIVIPPFTGNVRIQGGTLRAAPTFASDRYLIEVGSSTCTPKDHQNVCNEFIAIENVFLDGAHVAAGGVVVWKTMGTTVGPSTFVTGFNVAGVLVEQGHETMVLDSWIAEYYWSETHPAPSTCSPAAGEGSVGIELVGEDNYVQNVIIFDYTCLGVLVNGAASLLEGVHSWNGGGVAILVNGSYDIQDRIVGCYLDYSVLQVVNPNMIVVQDSFFYNAHAVLTGDVIKNLVMHENTYSLNQYGGNRSIVLTNPLATCSKVDISDAIDGIQGKQGVDQILGTRARMSLHLSAATKWTFDFSGTLLFSTIDTIQYSLTVDEGSPLVMHGARPPNGMSVTIETNTPTSGTVALEVTQCA